MHIAYLQYTVNGIYYNHRKGINQNRGNEKRFLRMKKNFNVNGHEIEITTCTAIAVEIDSTTRENALLVHDLEDEFRDGDSIYFENMPSDDEEAASMLADFDGFHDCTTLETVILGEGKG